jgi:hypothetical protein
MARVPKRRKAIEAPATPLEQFRLYYELLWLDAAHAVWLVVIPMICVASYCLLTTVARER